MSRCCPLLVEKNRVAAAAKAAKEAAARGEDDPNAHGAFCYVCGRDAPSAASLVWHVRKCLAAWDAREAAKPRERQRARARPRLAHVVDAHTGERLEPPDGDARKPQIMAWNAAARRAYAEHCVRCHVCGRGPFEGDAHADADEKLRRHLAQEHPDAFEALEATEARARERQPDPIGALCHICGQVNNSNDLTS